MIRKKVVLVGAFAVGKTSLVRRFVESIFSERYHTTVGVRVDKKELELDGREVTLVIWDLHGEDDFQTVRDSYFRGSSGFLLVVDGTRAATLATARAMCERVRKAVGEVPFVCLVNKADVAREWEVEDEELAQLEEEGWTVFRTSAKTGEGVEEAFVRLARRTLAE